MNIYILDNGPDLIQNANWQWLNANDLLTMLDAVPPNATPVTISNEKGWQTKYFSYLPNSSDLQARRMPEPFSYIISADLDTTTMTWVWYCSSSNSKGESACMSLGGKQFTPTWNIGAATKIYRLY